MLIVKTYSGYKADVRPISFSLDGKEYIVKEIVKSWVGEACDFWRVKTDAGKELLLKRDRNRDEWEIEEI